MSQYIKPFLALNLGSEMVFVIAQRLEAQNVAPDKASFVLDEIISVLISSELITEVMKPQAPYGHETVRLMIEDVAQSSLMRLDSNSMDKLWDLITMVFKWQLTLSSDLIKLTLRHLYEVETHVINPETQLQLHRVQNLIDNFNKILSTNERNLLRVEVLNWLKNFNVRVSLLLRMGLQTPDGSFVMNNTNPVAEAMLKNLGENIYFVTQKEKKDDERERTDGCEMQLFADQILGDRKLNLDKVLKLTIRDHLEEEKEDLFKKIQVTAENNKLQDIFSEMSLTEAENAATVSDDLLGMIATDKD